MYLSTTVLARVFQVMGEIGPEEWGTRRVLYRLRQLHPEVLQRRGPAGAYFVPTQKVRHHAPELHDHILRLWATSPDVFKPPPDGRSRRGVRRATKRH